MDAMSGIIQAALDTAHAQLYSPIDASPKGNYPARVLACSALLRTRHLPATTVCQKLGLTPGTVPFTAERLREVGVRDLDIKAVVASLVRQQLPRVERAVVNWKDPAKVSQLRELVYVGLSSAEIADKMVTTRGAIVSKAARLGLHFRGAKAHGFSAPPAPRSGPDGSLSPAAPGTPVPADGPLPDTARPWLERGPLQCSWPFTTPAGVWSCCAPFKKHPQRRITSWAYCDAHNAAMFGRGPTQMFQPALFFANWPKNN